MSGRNESVGERLDLPECLLYFCFSGIDLQG